MQEQEVLSKKRQDVNVKENSQWDFFSNSELNKGSNQSLNSKSIAYFDSNSDEAHQNSYHLILENFVKRGFRVASINQMSLENSGSSENSNLCCSNVLKTELKLENFITNRSGVHYLNLKSNEIFTALYSEQDFLIDLISDLKNMYDVVFVKMEIGSVSYTHLTLPTKA